jgi:hypothetical protein
MNKLANSKMLILHTPYLTITLSVTACEGRGEDVLLELLQFQ